MVQKTDVAVYVYNRFRFSTLNFPYTFVQEQKRIQQSITEKRDWSQTHLLLIHAVNAE